MSIHAITIYAIATYTITIYAIPIHAMTIYVASPSRSYTLACKVSHTCR